MELADIKMIQENLNVIKSGICRTQCLFRSDFRDPAQELLRVLSQSFANVEQHFFNLAQSTKDAAANEAELLAGTLADAKLLMDYSFTEELESYCAVRNLDPNQDVDFLVMKAFHDKDQDHIFCTIARLYSDLPPHVQGLVPRG
jgi:hypothetical protein